MKADLDLRLVHDGHYWVASNDTVQARGRTLPELDANLIDSIRETGAFASASRVSVFMGFDYDTIPTWIRQYAYHYFNRTVSLEL